MRESKSDEQAIARVFALTYGRPPTEKESVLLLAHWRQMEQAQSEVKPARATPPLEVRRDAVEENTGEKFSFIEKLHSNAEFVPDPQPADFDARTRALADVCLAIFNSNEFAYVY
jgi:hypothetical protein